MLGTNSGSPCLLELSHQYTSLQNTDKKVRKRIVPEVNAAGSGGAGARLPEGRGGVGAGQSLKRVEAPGMARFQEPQGDQQVCSRAGGVGAEGRQGVVREGPRKDRLFC